MQFLNLTERYCGFCNFPIPNFPSFLLGFHVCFQGSFQDRPERVVVLPPALSHGRHGVPAPWTKVRQRIWHFFLRTSQNPQITRQSLGLPQSGVADGPTRWSFSVSHALWGVIVLTHHCCFPKQLTTCYVGNLHS